MVVKKIFIVKKTLLSYQVGMSTFKFFDAGTKAFENEIGMSSTEVGIFVLKSATEKAVEELIFDGEKKGLWKFKTSKQEEVVKKEIDEKPISTALPIKDVVEEKATEIIETKPPRLCPIRIISLYISLFKEIISLTCLR